MHPRMILALHRSWPNLISYRTPTCALTANAYSDSTLSVVSNIPPHMLVHHVPTLYVLENGTGYAYTQVLMFMFLGINAII